MGREFGKEWLEFESLDRNKVNKDMSFRDMLYTLRVTRGLKDLELVLDKYQFEKESLSDRDLRSLENFLFYANMNYWDYEFSVKYYSDLDRVSLQHKLVDVYREFNMLQIEI